MNFKKEEMISRRYHLEAYCDNCKKWVDILENWEILEKFPHIEECYCNNCSNKKTSKNGMFILGEESYCWECNIFTPSIYYDENRKKQKYKNKDLKHQFKLICPECKKELNEESTVNISKRKFERYLWYIKNYHFLSWAVFIIETFVIPLLKLVVKTNAIVLPFIATITIIEILALIKMGKVSYTVHCKEDADSVGFWIIYSIIASIAFFIVFLVN